MKCFHTKIFLERNCYLKTLKIDLHGVEARLPVFQKKATPRRRFRLVTNILHRSPEEVVRKYAKRWKIEEFSEIIKSIFKFEKCTRSPCPHVIRNHIRDLFLQYAEQLDNWIKRDTGEPFRPKGEMNERRAEEMDDFLTSLLEGSAAETIESLWEGRDRLEVDDFEELMLALNNVADQVELHSDMILKDAQRGVDAKTKSMKENILKKLRGSMREVLI